MESVSAPLLPPTNPALPPPDTISKALTPAKSGQGSFLTDGGGGLNGEVVASQTNPIPLSQPYNTNLLTPLLIGDSLH